MEQTVSKRLTPDLNVSAIDPMQPLVRVRIKNVKSGRYLSIQGEKSDWNNDDASLTIRDWLNIPTLGSPQVRNIIQFRETAWILLNQYSMRVACIRARSTDNNATVIQYFTQNDIFQQWNFEKLENGNWLIKNLNSKKYIGPENRSTSNDHFCIQWDNQTKEDSFQEWQFEAV